MSVVGEERLVSERLLDHRRTEGGTKNTGSLLIGSFEEKRAHKT